MYGSQVKINIMKNLLTGDFMIIIYFFLSSIRFTIMSMGDLSKIEDHKYDKNAFMPFEKNCYGSNMLGRIIRIF